MVRRDEVKDMPKPTQKDAELLLQVMALIRDAEGRRAHRWLLEEFDVKSYRRFRQKYPRGSLGSTYFDRVMSDWEILATLALNGLISDDLVFDMFFVKPFWDKAEPIVQGLRKEWKSPRLYENFEVLVQRALEWDKTHPPKITTVSEKKK